MTNVQNSVSPQPGSISRSHSHSFVSRPALVFDLDETLVYCTPIKPASDDCFPIKVHRRRVFVHMRPGVLAFLRDIQHTYDIFFFTASHPDYANQIINRIAPSIPLSHRFFRSSCQSSCGYLVKDLRIINRPLSRILLLDDTAGSALANPHNYVRIPPWNGGRTDTLLMNRLLPFLESLACEKDLVRAVHDILTKQNSTDISLFPYQ
jgi:Dullard-like phosphatase family protein